MTSHRYTSLFLIALLFVAGITVGKVVSAEDCPAGTRIATTADAVVQNGAIKAGTCYDPNDANIGQTDEVAKKYLMEHATKNSNISCLNADYAEKLAKLMQAVPGGPPTITDGYRSPQAQANLPAGSTQVGACGSYHQYGMAADFNNASKATLLWMRIHAPEYGLTRIPALSIVDGCSLKGSGFCDPAHIQINAPLPPRNQCGICATTGTSGSGALPEANTSATPDDIIYYNQTRTAPTYAPTTFPGAPVPTTAPAATPIATPATTATTPLSNTTGTSLGICTPQFSCSSNVMYYQTTSCTTQVYQTCTNGCNGNSCSAIASTPATSTLVTNPNTSQASSTQDLLDAFANPVSLSSTPIGTATSIGVVLNGDISNIAQIDSAGSSSSTVTINPGTITSIQPVGGQQTFTSSDMSNTDASSFNAQPTSGIAKILSDLRSALTWAIQFLKSS